MGHKEEKLALPVSELIRELEKGEINPKTLDKVTKRKYSKILMDNGYDSTEIAELLKVTTRSIQRYLKELKKENALKLGYGFQKEILGEVEANEKRRVKELLQILNSADLPYKEKVNIISLLHKMDVDKVIYLEKAGYISKERGQYDLRNSESIGIGWDARAMGRRWALYEQLTPGQKAEITSFYSNKMCDYPYLKKEIRQRADEMIDNYISENVKHRKDIIRGVGPFSQLYCKVFVINMLCNN